MSKEKENSFFVDDKIHWVDVELISPDEDNPRMSIKKVDPARYQALKDSLDRGLFAPIKVEKSTMELIAGHQRLEAAKDLGFKELPVIYLRDLTYREKVDIRISDNAQYGAWDFTKLATQVEASDFSGIELGLSENALEGIGAINPPDTEEMEPDKDQDWQVLSINLPIEVYTRVRDVIDRICDEHDCSESTAFEYMIESYVQDPNNNIE